MLLSITAEMKTTSRTALPKSTLDGLKNRSPILESQKRGCRLIMEATKEAYISWFGSLDDLHGRSMIDQRKLNGVKPVFHHNPVTRASRPPPVAGHPCTNIR